MFQEFFYLLRQYGLDVSITEWLTLQEALSRGLHGSSISGFYNLCRSVLCKSESEYDTSQRAFLDFFRVFPRGRHAPHGGRRRHLRR